MEKDELSKARTLAEEFMERNRPPEEQRELFDLGYSLEGRDLILFEIRATFWREGEKVKVEVAKAKYVKSRDLWKVYWMRASGKWELYDPKPEVKRIKDFFKLLDEDKYGAFWG